MDITLECMTTNPASIVARFFFYVYIFTIVVYLPNLVSSFVEGRLWPLIRAFKGIRRRRMVLTVMLGLSALTNWCMKSSDSSLDLMQTEKRVYAKRALIG
ncbi:hypothetical protein TNIN_132051 [Trichonephila inaurata madagascariensis]|uniref:Uncharacterized protein n=1 Tax=Trichonephila inaurata madagascariensis TaxID=2747483 RepID=A0A8X7C1C2_9ARAC|nr:hypothetical protein TNIN_455611 [Trichonephila inaurata madagascariensis]GFY51705.1 hypothetical protein TNIN_132051 [Trichonephila inaurata madagascariensis]